MSNSDDDDILELVDIAQDDHSAQSTVRENILDVNEDEPPELVPVASSSALSGEEEEVEPCPITLLTGFLGSGKTTLLNYILTEQHDRKIAVIMNEFGDSAGIESKALSISDPDNDGTLYEEMLELNNGCICCTVKDNGVKAIEALMQKRREAARQSSAAVPADAKGKGKSKAVFDYILLETTGLADPFPIAEMFWQDDALASEIYLDSVVCVVDAVYGLEQLRRTSNERSTFIQQIAAADVLLLNKVDLVDDKKKAQTIQAIRRVNATAPIYETIKGVIDLSHILGVNAYNAGRSRHPLSGMTASPVGQATYSLLQDRRPDPLQPEAPAECDACDSEQPHTHAQDLAEISSLSIPFPVLTPLQMERLESTLRSLLWDAQLPGTREGVSTISGIEVLRTKGVFSVVEKLDGTETITERILQGVREIYDIKIVSASTRNTTGDQGRLVLIGKGLTGAMRETIVERILHD